MIKVDIKGIRQVQAALARTTDDIEQRAETAVNAACEALAGWAKTEHTYTDRTTNLTNSIGAVKAEMTGQIVRGYLTAGMEYSFYLELAREGEWAFLWPTIERHQADVLQILQAHLGQSVKLSLRQAS